MKSAKRVMGILIVFFFLTVGAYAKQKQEAAIKPLNADDIVTKMKGQLGLSDQQVQEVKPIIEEYLEKEKKLKLEEKKELSHILTGDQLYTWNFLQNEPPHEKKHSKL